MPIQEDLQAFLAEWHDPSPFLEVQTSGSTGTPKRMRVRKDRMLNSARLTCDYLGLKKGDKALLCMPLRYIAGKMMVVRSLYAGLDLEVREPSGHPLADWGDTPLRFAAMIPLQVYNTLRVPEERKRLEQTDILIIGGGAIDAALEQEIRQMPNTVYSTYDCMEDAMAAAGPCEDPILRLQQLFADLNGIPVLHGTSACKRLAMFLRWMVRTDGIVDLGIWRTAVNPRQLIIPLDTHVHQISLRLGLTGQKTATLRTAREITDALAKVFPDDPCLGDFALFGYDINQE